MDFSLRTASDRWIYMDGEGAIFCLSAFITLNGLPDDPRLRSVIIEEMRSIFPEIRIPERDQFEKRSRTLIEAESTPYIRSAFYLQTT
jgi:hypothetical protein